jgi:hypothetical protein
MTVLHKTFRTLSFMLLLLGAPLAAYNMDGNLQPSLGHSNINTESLDKNFLDQSCKSCKLKSKKVSKKHIKPKPSKKHVKLSYYLNVEDFVESFIEIPTSNVSSDSTTISSKYLAGRAALYNRKGIKVGTCSASFLCMQNVDGIYTDISNFLSVDNGLVVSWFTPTTLINLELDSIVHSMVTECLVDASTKIGFNPFYGKVFNMIVSSESGRIYFKLTQV